ncbi:STT3 domain-containing protein [Thermococcus sp. 9N3]|uniref:STT3 domain-containing protein n=1 Tax=Thermococcus sp. 9N3 TaxID=163002 RepID=UPI001431C073|nr:STT3 domain-containing protein [Thermococcus sp. 9N3]NJE49408.1 oligosaccharyl transferase, STT3 subunit [Thermococcus sp. 9N3]
MKWRLKSETASHLYRKLIEPKFAVPIIAVVALILRLLPMHFKYLLGYDPFFHLAYIRYALEKGEWVNFFPYAFGPWGMQIKLTQPLGLWMTPAFIYKLLHPFGVSLYNAFRITPVIFGVLTIIFIYLAVLKLYGKREAFLSAFLLAVSFGHVFRSMAGYYRGDNYMLFWYSLALLGIALGLTWKPKRWKYERFVFYLIPGIATGLSAIFWQAYYPIFAFVLANAVLLSIGAFLLREDERILDGLAIALSTALGALIANALGGIFGYGMVGYNRWLGKKFAEELGVQFGFMKDLFLLLYVKYALPLAVTAIIALIVLARVVRGWKARVSIVGALVLVSVVLTGHYYGIIQNLLEKIFTEAPIAETQRTSLSDLWTAYGPTFVAVPLFALSFRRKNLGDYVALGLGLVAIPMLLIWTRFLFIGSLAVAVMAGVGLASVSDLIADSSKKYLSLALSGLVIAVPLTTAVVGVQNTLSVKPIVNNNWARALEYLSNHSNINDVVLTWWDEGHWVTYFAERAPVAQASAMTNPSKIVAKYYIGKIYNKSLMNLGVDYVIVSLDAVEKFGAILETAGESGYAMILLKPVSTPGVLTFAAPGYTVMATPGESWDAKVRIGNVWGVPAELFIEKGTKVEKVPLKGKPTMGAYVYINLNYGYAVLMNAKAFNTSLARLMFTDEYPKDYKLIYSDGGIVKIFKFVHPNVIVTSENGSVVLRFENASGTGLGVYGYLDNGTLVFKKWYNVEDRREFILPKNLNGSVVVRYTYTKSKTVLDRGVLRVDDTLRKNKGIEHQDSSR